MQTKTQTTEQTTKQTTKQTKLLYYYQQAWRVPAMLAAIATTVALSTVVVWGGVYLLCQAAVYVHGLLY